MYSFKPNTTLEEENEDVCGCICLQQLQVFQNNFFHLILIHNDMSKEILRNYILKTIFFIYVLQVKIKPNFHWWVFNGFSKSLSNSSHFVY